MKKMLMLASVASMIDQFNIPNIVLLQEMGYEVHVACNFEKGSTCTPEKVKALQNRLDDMGVRYFQIDFSRNILKVNEILTAYKQVKQLLEKEKYTFIHCHSPIGGAVGRLATHRTHTKVIYTAHGFHFYKGAPLLNWLIYYPIEKWLSRYTDVLITINKEDYQRAKQKFHAKETRYIPGVGIDVEKIQAVQVDRDAKRRELGIEPDDFLLLSVGELNKNKNHEVVIRALAELNDKKVKYAICGKGDLKEYLEELAEKLGVRDQLFLLGFRTDVIEICKSADVFVFPSKREGLGLAALEGMACGLPLITSNRHGINDYSKTGISGYKYKPSDVKGFANGINRIRYDKMLKEKVKNYNEEIVKEFDVGKSKRTMRSIYIKYSR